MTYTVELRKIPYYIVANTLVWCYENLSYGKDFDYSDETAIVNGIEAKAPQYLWFDREEDVLALRLKFDL